MIGQMFHCGIEELRHDDEGAGEQSHRPPDRLWSEKAQREQNADASGDLQSQAMFGTNALTQAR